jgi:aldose 1-epimerase
MTNPGASPSAAGFLPPSGRQFEFSSGEFRATVAEVGGVLRSFTVGDRPVIDGFPVDEMPTGARGQTLVPWPNRLADGQYDFGGRSLQLALTEPSTHNAIHGLVRWVDFECLELTASSCRVGYRLPPHPGYPFRLAVEISFRLDSTGLTIETSARNDGREPAPFALGTHPYLTTGSEQVDGDELTLPADTYLLVDERSLPTGRAPVAGTEWDFRSGRRIGGTHLDTCYTDLHRGADGKVTVTLRGGAAGVRLWADSSYSYLQAYSGDTLPAAHRRRGLAVEPMTAPANAFRTGEGLLVLEPGETTRHAFGIAPL